jgi:hypothetical protein
MVPADVQSHQPRLMKKNPLCDRQVNIKENPLTRGFLHFECRTNRARIFLPSLHSRQPDGPHLP